MAAAWRPEPSSFSQDVPAPAESSLRPRREHALGCHLALDDFAGGMETQALVKASRAMPVRMVAHGQPVLAAARGFAAQAFHGESPITLALVTSRDVQPPQVAVIQRGRVFLIERGHEEADELPPVVDQPGPRDTG